MTEQPNIKRQVLEYVIGRRQREEVVAVNLREFADDRDFEEHRVANAVQSLGYALDWGVSPMGVWPDEKDEAAEWFDKWGADLPDGFDSAGWY